METDNIVYKYRSWSEENHRKTLEKNQFYFSSPADINDPFDCRVSPDLLLLDTPEKRNRFIEDMLNDAKRILHDKKIDHLERAKVLLRRLEDDIDNMQQEYDEMHSRYTNDRFGVISFSLRWDSILIGLSCQPDSYKIPAQQQAVDVSRNQFRISDHCE